MRAAEGGEFSLSHVTDAAARAAGFAIRSKSPVPLLREALVAERDRAGVIVIGTRPLPHGEAIERFTSTTDVCRALEAKALDSVTVRPTETNAARRIAEQFLLGASVIGDDAPWSERRKREAIDALAALVKTTRKARQTSSAWDWQVVSLPASRSTSQSSENKWAKTFHKSRSYDGWAKSMEPAATFDAKGTEFRLAQLFDNSPSVVRWLRLDGRTAYIEMEDGTHYHPDFIVVDADDVHWLVESKADRDAIRPDVLIKRQAAEEWATFVRDRGDSVYGATCSLPRALSDKP
ncbi:hypothetical protein [Nocardia abscessus]|uniref:hypothetical protein n=1 Tax=Nocardia abscessus TaxID=120957 RepID=UPI0024542768|nr:hypothetical protein [Nocardia abscessus]